MFSEKVHVMNHPLVAHKLTILRDKNTSVKDFRELVSEIGMLITYEATRDLPLTTKVVETPLCKAELPTLAGKKFAVVPILRAGLGLVDGVLRMVPSARVGHIGMFRDEETLEPHVYFCKMPKDVADRDIIIVDPMLATGGSAEAAAVLVGLTELYGARLSMSELCALGASIGADVPFALMGGTCRVQGVGALLKPLPPVPDCWFTVVMPDYGVSTPEAFAAYDQVGSTVHPDCETQEAAVRAGDLDAVCAAAGNALEEYSGAKDTGAIKALLREKGAVTALMTGSGSAVFGIFRDETSARAAAAAAKHRWKQVYTAQPDKGGARVV